MRSQLFAMVLALAPLASASALADVRDGLDNILVRRQDGNTNTNTNTNTNGPQQTAGPTQTNTKNPPATPTATKGNGPQTTNLNTGGGPQTTNLNTGGGPAPTGSTGNGTTGGNSTSTMFNPQDPAGGVVMVTPAASLGTQLVQIEEPTPVTWVWNYTSVQGTPSAIDVLISCSTASQTITLTQNMTYKSPQTFTWDHAAYAATAVANQLRTDLYTLVIYDASSAPTEQAQAGYLAPFNQFIFGLYASQPYTNLADGWQCITCSSAPGGLDRTALGFATSMSIITVLSFTWFVGGLGAIL